MQIMLPGNSGSRRAIVKKFIFVGVPSVGLHPRNEGNNQFRISIPGGEMLPVTDADPEGLSLKNSNNMRQGSQELELKGSPWAARFTAIARS